MHLRALVLSLSACWSLTCFSHAVPDLPPRPPNAEGGTAIATRLAALDQTARERVIVEEILAGNVPDSWRRFVPVTLRGSVCGKELIAGISVAPDYLAVGSDEDYLLTPLSPQSAQAIADRLGCVLPTRRMVDEIYRAAKVKLTPSPIPPSPDMIKVETWVQHQAVIRDQRAATKGSGLIAGHKKDVVITSQLTGAPGKVAIYGWHRPDGSPIQPLYLGHTEKWVDYSHGIRLVSGTMTVDGKATRVDEVLANPELSALLSDEGVISAPRYPKPHEGSASDAPEKTETLHFDPGVRVVLDSRLSDDPSKPVQLILFALPSGNSIEQTIGRHTNPGDDWHFNIQHIGAQTRWLRQRLPDTEVVVAYLECAEKSWPAWRKKNDPTDERIPEIVDALRKRFVGRKLKLVLTGHSGGGSFTFGFLNGVEKIPDDVERIAFLDSNYAYDSTKGHDEKLAAWLKASDSHNLVVIAYEDYIALLEGKTFVSENGGTWGRSRAMITDFTSRCPFLSDSDEEWERHTALNGRVKFLMRKNPAKAVLHTRLVEFNGFIHAILAGTSLEDRDYTFFGPRVYEGLILAD
jgi:hypothetical protein